MCDTTPRTKDWYMQLVIVLSIIIEKVATRKRIKLPTVINVLCTNSDGLILDVSADNSTGAASSAHHVHGLGSTPPEHESAVYLKLVQSRRDFILPVIKKLKGEEVESWFRVTNGHPSSNFGRCAETLPYIAYVLFNHALAQQ